MNGSALGGQHINAAQKAALIGSAGVDIAHSGLVRIANQIAEATARVDHIAGRLSDLSLGIHGQHPAANSLAQHGQAGGQDSLAARAVLLLEAVDRLQGSLESIAG